MTSTGRVSVRCRRDGLWEWAYHDEEIGADLASSKAYTSADEAEHDARVAYPGIRVEIEKSRRRDQLEHSEAYTRGRELAKLAGAAAVTAALVFLLRRLSKAA